MACYRGDLQVFFVLFWITIPAHYFDLNKIVPWSQTWLNFAHSDLAPRFYGDGKKLICQLILACYSFGGASAGGDLFDNHHEPLTTTGT